ncbi:unnamed protein product [Parajaminaea phylloscopi]
MSQPPAAPHEEEPEASSAVALECRTLMQMLSLVGSRLLEADQIGLTGADSEAVGPQDAAPPRDDSAPGRGDLEGSLPERGINQEAYRNACSTINSHRLQVVDDEATPRGGHTPLVASKTLTRRSSQPSRPSSSLQHEVVADLCALQKQEDSDSESASSDASNDGETADAAELHRHANLAAARKTDSAREDSPQINFKSSERLETEPTTHAEGLDAKLRGIFELSATEHVRAHFACWLFRTVLLQGSLYVTNSHLLFYAYLPSREDKVIKAGSLRKKTRRTYRFSRHWAVLRGRALSWYDNAHDPYFPRDHIDLRRITAIRAAKRNPRHFHVSTAYREFTFGVESQASRDDWVDVLQKAAFRAQNDGESVRISIPIEAIVDVDDTTEGIPLSTAGMTSVQVVEWETDEFALDEYHFLHFAGSQRARFLEMIKGLLAEQQRSFGGPSSGVERRPSFAMIKDSTGSIARSNERLPVETAPKLRRVDPQRIAQSISPSVGVSKRDEGESESHVSERAAAIAIPRPATSDRRSSEDSLEAALSTTPRGVAPLAMAAGTLSAPSASMAYPPVVPAAQPSSSRSQLRASRQGRSWQVPHWVRNAHSRWIPSTSNVTNQALDAVLRQQSRIRPVTEIWSTLPPTLAAFSSIGSHMKQDATPGVAIEEDLESSRTSAFSVIDAASSISDDDGDAQVEHRGSQWVRDTFALTTEEQVFAQFEGYLYRILPLAGTLFLSQGHLCFLSSTLATKTMGRTKMVLPLGEIISCAKHKAYHFGQHGLVLTIRGHEELFLEFSTQARRDECMRLLEEKLEELLRDTGGEDEQTAARKQQARSDAIVLTDLMREEQGSMSDSMSSLASDMSSLTTNSSNMSLLSFRPRSGLHFTLLTIGSRGDVQPYLSLAKGLKAEGHQVRIATHAEFGPWIEQHDIEFREIGGDPAELMRICVDNGTFTVAFLREGVTKFRGWLDDLLVSCWAACQGTNVIIESPNALAGIHVAEALQVPYFRAFTMPWSRTRAYPQAFAVPSKKAGGSYNYMSYVIFDQVLWRASAGQVNRWREKILGLPPTTYDLLEQHKIPYLYSFSPSLVPKPLDWYDWIHVTGFWFLDNPENSARRAWTPPSDLVDFIDTARARGKKIVYVGWGSITVPDAAATTRCVLEAVRRSGVCAILSKGWSERLSANRGTAVSLEDDFAALSDQVFRVESVPHDWLFPLIDAACHHGGAGTIGASLRAGLPTIVKPWFGDQFFWGQQVESLGVGSYLPDLTVANLCEGLVQATQNSKQIERAQRLGERIRAETGVAEAIKAIYSDLDYATDLIKQRVARTGPRRPHALAVTSVDRDDSVGLPDAKEPHKTPNLNDVSSFADRPLELHARSRANSSAAASEDWSVVSGSDGGEPL